MIDKDIITVAAFRRSGHSPTEAVYHFRGLGWSDAKMKRACDGFEALPVERYQELDDEIAKLAPSLADAELIRRHAREGLSPKESHDIIVAEGWTTERIDAAWASMGLDSKQRELLNEQMESDAALVAAHADSGLDKEASRRWCTSESMGWAVSRHERAWLRAESRAQQNALAHGSIVPLTPNTRRQIHRNVSDAQADSYGELRSTSFGSAGLLKPEHEKLVEDVADLLAGSTGARTPSSDVTQKILNVVKGLPRAEAKLVIERAQHLLQNKEARLTGELGKVRRTHQHADDLIRGVVDPYDAPSPLMSRLLDQHNGKSATDYLEKFWSEAHDRPTGGWEDRLGDDMARFLAGKATYQGRPATEDDIRNSLEATNAQMAGMSANARAVYRIIVTTAAGRTQRDEGGFTVDIGVMLNIAKWSETAALKFWADPVFKETAGSAAAYEARLTVIARLMREVAEQVDLGPLEFTYAVFVILIWWQADERPPNYVAEETVHAVLQAGSETGTSPWTEPTLLWLGDWWQSAFSRINVGHKLAAALALTDVPADVPHSPWKAWSLLIPDGMFQNTDKVAGWDLVAHNQQDRTSGPSVAQILDQAGDDNTWTGVRLRRAWFRGTELIGLLADWVFDGDHIDNGRVLPIKLQCAVAAIGESMEQAVGPDVVDMVRSLGLGVLAAITNQPAQKTGQWGITKKKPGKKKPERIQLGDVWGVASPVTIDLREHVRSIQAGKTRARSAPTAAWVVRGHWRNQVHGAGRMLRKQTWIEPYWKGEESMRKLMRGVEVKE